MYNFISYTTFCEIHQLVSESQLSYIIVNLLTITNQNMKLTVLWGSWVVFLKISTRCVGVDYLNVLMHTLWGS